MDTTLTDLGRTAYTTYCEAVGWKSPISGETLPEWDDLMGVIQQGWITAAGKIVDSTREPEIGEHILLCTRSENGVITQVSALVGFVHSRQMVNVVVIDLDAEKDQFGFSVNRELTSIMHKDSVAVGMNRWWDYPKRSVGDSVGAAQSGQA